MEQLVKRRLPIAPIGLGIALATALVSAPALVRARQDVPKHELAYGPAAAQTLDFYPAASNAPAPLMMFVHGGAWSFGDKGNATGKTKIGFFHARGMAFASVDYRLVPRATVEDEAQDVADALAYLLRDANRLGIDTSRVVLMGHSAGAHLVALIGTDPRYLAKDGLSEAQIAGVVLLDGAAYDVPAQMQDGPMGMHRRYAQAFGDDPVRQRALSPTLQAAPPNAPAFLILHIDRADGTRQSEALAAALSANGARVELHGVPGQGLAGHAAINRQLGNSAQPATQLVANWLDRLLAK